MRSPAGRAPDLGTLSKDEALAWRVAEEMMFTRRVTEATYRAALAGLGEQRLGRGNARGLLRARLDDPERRPLPAAFECAARRGRGARAVAAERALSSAERSR
jgi:hypothetical protein